MKAQPNATKNNKRSSREVAKQKRFRRQIVTILRICRYGANNFTRNAWLTIAATAVMTITLLIIFVSVAGRNILSDSIEDLRDRVSMSIYLETNTTKEQAESVKDDLINLDSIEDVQIETSEQARENFIKENSSDPNTLKAVNEATNRFPVTLHIKVADINDTSELQNFVDNNENLKLYIDTAREPSFAGERKTSIETIAQAAQFTETAGLVASIIFVVISSLIIFNTIRMAIYNRKEEIEMMKLIGADKSFIRGPFVVEAMVYGFIAAFIATAGGIGILYWIRPRLQEIQIPIDQTFGIVVVYAGFVLLAMIGIGVLIGTISSLLATRRYLKL